MSEADPGASPLSITGKQDVPHVKIVFVDVQQRTCQEVRSILENVDGVGHFKVVQMSAEGQPVLLCGTKLERHSEILRVFLEKSNVAFTTVPTIGSSAVRIPEGPGGGKYTVEGMGEMGVEARSNCACLPFDTTGDPRTVSEDFNRKLRAFLASIRPGIRFLD